jgi:glycosyltransferase involved in cell wall biosynthesis
VSQRPKLSVLMPTYNHERFIAQAVHSVLAQQVDFALEIVIGEDCSTDRTRDIVRELAQEHPAVIRLITNERNIGAARNFAQILAASRGQYAAILEGDDYFTDASKLQKQCNALDANPAWSACFHPTRMLFEDTSRPPTVYPPSWSQPTATIDDLFQQNFIGTCSIVFRNGLFGKLPDWHREIVPGDWVLHILNADRGPIGFLPDVMADYRVHSRGMWSGKPLAEKHAEVLRMLTYVDHHFQGKYRRQIDEYRIGLVKRLTEHCESLEQHNLWLRSRAQAKSSAAPRHSPAFQLGRVVMRPLERFGKRMAAAAGIRLRLR